MSNMTCFSMDSSSVSDGSLSGMNTDCAKVAPSGGEAQNS